MSGFVSSAERHPNRNAIISRVLAGDTLKSIAADFNLSVGILSRFKRKIVRPAVFGTQTKNNQEIVNIVRGMREGTKQNATTLVVGTSTADLVARKLARYDRILELAEKDKDVSGWASVDRAETAALQLQAQLRGEVNQVHSQTTVQMLVYTPQVMDEGQEQGQVVEVEALPAPESEPEPVAELPPPVKRQPKPPKPPSRMQLLQKLSAAERKQAIRLIGQGIDPFAPPPAPPPAR